MPKRHRYPAITALSVLPALSMGLLGCTASGDPNLSAASSLITDAVSTPSVENIVPASPVEVYSRIASSANKCWFSGPEERKSVGLTNHVFHAEADHNRQAAIIKVHEKAADDKKGLKSFQITMAAAPDGKTKLGVKNYRLTPERASRIEADVKRWADGATQCMSKTDVPTKVTGKPDRKLAEKLEGGAVPVPQKAPAEKPAIRSKPQRSETQTPNQSRRRVTTQPVIKPAPVLRGTTL